MRAAILVLMGALTLLAQDAPKTGVVEGSVVNSVTGEGIEGAAVQFLPKNLAPAQNHDQYRAVSDATGGFRIADVKPGDYTPTAEKTGFFSVGGPIFFGGNSIHVEAGAESSGVRIELAPPARVRGRVIDVDGKPMAHVQVAIGRGYTNYTTTNDDGIFVLGNVEPGPQGLLTRANHMLTYFPSALDPALAEPITVLPGEDQAGYEIRLQNAVTHRVRGVVLNPAGKPEPKALVEMIPGSGDAAPAPRGGLLSMAASGTTRFSITRHVGGVEPERDDPVVAAKDGTFEFPSVREGDWIFRVETNDLVHGVAAVAVRKDVDDLRIRLDAPFELNGSVTLSDGSPAPQRLFVMARLISIDGLPEVDSPQRKDRALHFANVAPGRYLIQTMALTGSYYVASAMVGTVDATRQPVSLSAASPPIRIVVKSGVSITGTVEKGDGASVLIVPESPAPGDMGWLLKCGAGGSFEVAGLPPGEYAAIAVNNFDFQKLPLLSDIDQLRIVIRDATTVRIEEGAAASVQLKPPIDLP